MEKKRIVYLDYIKAIACVLVVLQHVATYGYLSTENNAWIDYWVSNHPANLEDYIFNVIFIAVAKVAVPLFVMVNGALMLQKDIDYKKIFQKYILRCIEILLFWNILMAVCTFLDGGTVNDVLSVLAFGYQQFWFIYTLIGLYIFQPLLRVIVKNEKLLDIVIIIFGAVIILNSLTIFAPRKIGEVIIHLLSETGISDFPKWGGYYCLGYFLYKRKDNLKNWQCLIGVIVVLGSILYAIFQSQNSQNFALDSIEVFSFSTMVLAIIIFEVVKNYEYKIKILSKPLNVINKNSFFIYASHCLLIELALHFRVSLDLFNFIGIGVLIGTACIIIILILIKKLIVDRFKFLKGFCEW